ncbi:MAG: hypothetical protein GY754_19555 [bacterium]|nr:hypothetical protein [bacterium]
MDPVSIKSFIISLIAFMLPYAWIFFIIIFIVCVPFFIKFYYYTITGSNKTTGSTCFILALLFGLIILSYSTMGSYLTTNPNDDSNTINFAIERSQIGFVTALHSKELQSFVNWPIKTKNIAWTSLLSLFMKISPGIKTPFYINSVIHILELLLLCSIILALFKDYRILLFMIPLLAFNYASIETAFRPRAMVLSRFLLTLTCFSLLSYNHYKKKLLYILAITAAALAIHTRLENIMIIIPIIYMELIVLKDHAANKKMLYWAVFLLLLNFFIIVPPLVFHYFSTSNQSFDFMRTNSALLEIFQSYMGFVIFFALSFGTILIYLLIPKKDTPINGLNLKSFALFYIAPFFMITLIWPTMGDEGRFVYLIMPLVSLLSALTVFKVSRLFVSPKSRVVITGISILAFISFHCYYILVSNDRNIIGKAQYAIISQLEKVVSPHCVLVVSQKDHYFHWKGKMMDFSEFNSSNKKSFPPSECYILVRDYYCLSNNIESRRDTILQECNAIRQNIKTKPVKTYPALNEDTGFYRMLPGK